MKTGYRSFVWLLPFCFFVAGYVGTRLYVAPTSFLMPSLVGMHAHEALTCLSDCHLMPRILAHKQEDTLAPGTILRQTPAPNQTVKPSQSVFLVLSKRAAPPRMPSYVQQRLADIQQQSKDARIVPMVYHVPHNWPKDTCFAQWPSAHTPLKTETSLVYVSTGNNQPVVWPNFIGHDAHEVITFLQEHDITPDIICHYTQADEDSYEGYQVTDQRPLPGSFVPIDQPDQLMVQLRVE